MPKLDKQYLTFGEFLALPIELPPNNEPRSINASIRGLMRDRKIECDLALMSELEGGKSPEANKLYLAIDAGKQELFYKVKKFDMKFKICAAYANNGNKFIGYSRIVMCSEKLPQGWKKMFCT